MVDKPVSSGLDLVRRFFHDVVEPVVGRTVGNLRYVAALIGPGSEVLGYDTVMSRNFDSAPRVQLFLSPQEEVAFGSALRDALDREWPETFDGFAVRIDQSDFSAGGALDHPVSGRRVVVDTVTGWMSRHLEWLDPTTPTVADWLATPKRRLLEFTAGRVSRDDSGDSTDVRRRLEGYPDVTSRYLLTCQWQRVAKLERFVGRPGDVGNDLGSRPERVSWWLSCPVVGLINGSIAAPEPEDSGLGPARSVTTTLADRPRFADGPRPCEPL